MSIWLIMLVFVLSSYLGVDRMNPRRRHSRHVCNFALDEYLLRRSEYSVCECPDHRAGTHCEFLKEGKIAVLAEEK